MANAIITHCRECGIEKLWYESECAACGGTTFESKGYPAVVNTSKEAIRTTVMSLLRKADGFIRTDQPCTVCGEDHYMVFPAKRDEKKYSHLERLTLLPRCPKEVWLLGGQAGIGMPLQRMLEDLQVDDAREV